ncbi:hypothetical protein C8R46DRAFT_1074529 [Mycena filopes]|nr:hypothetical protein C8R46DRAFT_1074529 [Mycena filopes]
MGSPVFPPADSAYTRVDPSAYAPKSTHNLPIGGLRPLATETAAKATPRGKFYLEPGPSGSSHSSSRSSNSYRDGEEHGSDSPSSRSGSGSGGSESSRERGEGSSSSVNSHPRGVGSARGRGRDRTGSSGRRSPDSREFQRPEMHEQPPKPEQAPQPPPAKQLQPQEQRPQSQPKPAPFLGRLGAGLEMTASPQSNGVDLDRDDARSVSSLTTSSSNVRVRVRGKQPARPPMRSQHSRSRSRKGGTRPGHAREGSAAQREAPNALGLPSELTAATALVERHMRTEGRSRVMVASDEEEGEWTDYEYESGVDGASAEGGEEEEEEVDEGDEEDGGWEDEDESESAQEVATNAKAPPPSLQQQQPGPHLGHARGHSTGGNDLRQLPSLRRSAGHLPALAAPTKHQHTASAQNARTARALNATMSATTLSSAMHEAQRQRELFAKAPRHSYENLTSLGAHPSGLTLLLGGRPQQVAEQYHQQQHQLQQQIEGRLPPPRQSRPGGLAGLGLMMTARPPTGAGGSELSPIPPTPASAALQPHHQQPPAVRQQSQLPPTPPPPQQKPPTPAQAGLLPRRPNMPRAMSTPHFGTPGTSGSVGKSAVAGPVVSGVGEGPEIVATPVLGPSTTTPQNGSASRSGYRPKGPPAGMEYDDEEDDESDAEGRGISKGKGRAHDEGIFSKSVAQEKLRVLAEKSAISSRAKNGGANGVEAGESERRRLFEQADDVPWAAAPKNPNASDDYVPQRPSNQSMSSGPVGFPYHLPVPAPPSTPRTTRQHMMRNEMSESLRLNLLWQRKTYRSDMTGPPPRRTKSTVNVTTVQGGRQPEKSLVRVTPRAPGAERRDATLPPMDPPVPAGAPKKKLVRNYSMGDTSTYHYAGW